jgi:LasA protease
MHRSILRRAGMLWMMMTLTACQTQPDYYKPASSTDKPQPKLHQPTLTAQAFSVTETSSSSSVDSTPTVYALKRTNMPLDPAFTEAPMLSGNNQMVYYAQSGDNLVVVARHFGIDPNLITSPDPLSMEGLLFPGQVLLLPGSSPDYTDSPWLIPDGDIVFSPSAADFDVAGYLEQTHGFLKSHREYLMSTGWTSAADILTRIAIENSINPRILLSLLEYRCNCVLSQPSEDVEVDFLLGNTDFRRKGLYRQLAWAASRLSVGYYGWRTGELSEISLDEEHIYPLSPGLNAGTVALQYFFAYYADQVTWDAVLNAQKGIAAVHTRLFGNPWEREKTSGPIFPAGTEQPPLILPFEPGRVWSFTSGPHTVWEKEGAQAAIDLAPATYYPGCVETDAWAVAMANGLVVREEYGAVIMDLDEVDGTPADGLEQTGWTILYMHIDSKQRVKEGTRLVAGQRIGHPSCEGGHTTGTHLHIARKFNGEWILAGSAIPFIMDGWVVHPGLASYQGTMTKDEQNVVAHPYGSFETLISRPTPIPTPTPALPEQ